MSKNNNTQKIVGLGLFTAIVIVLQLMGSFIRFGTFSISLVLVPVVIGAALYGAGAGAWLGFVFGVVVLLSGDAAAFLGVNALGTILTVLVKGTLAGLLSGLVYKALENKNRTLAVAVAAVVCPVVNTGVFLIGCLLFFMETIGGWADAMGFGANIGQYMIVGLVGANFIFEPLQRGAEPCGRASHPHRQEGSLIHKRKAAGAPAAFSAFWTVYVRKEKRRDGDFRRPSHILHEHDCKPGSVFDSHLSTRRVAAVLQPPRSGRANLYAPIPVLLRIEFTASDTLEPTGALLPHLSILT